MGEALIVYLVQAVAYMLPMILGWGLFVRLVNEQ